MKRALFLLLLAAATSSAAPAAVAETLSDYFPLAAAPEHHAVLLENDFVLVLDVSIPAGATVPAHLHPWPAVFITLEQAHLAVRNRAGALLRDSRPALTAGDRPLVEWRERDREPVVITNLDDHAQRAIRVELKFLGP